MRPSQINPRNYQANSACGNRALDKTSCFCFSFKFYSDIEVIKAITIITTWKRQLSLHTWGHSSVLGPGLAWPPFTTSHHKNVSPRGITLLSIHQAFSHMLCYPLLLFPASFLTPSSPAERLYRCKHLVTVYDRTPQHLFFFKCFKLSEGLGVIGPYPFPPMHSVSGVFFSVPAQLEKDVWNRSALK